MTLVAICGGDGQHCGSRPFVFHDLGLKLCPLEHRRFIVDINHLHAQHLRGGQLRYPMILCDDGKIVYLMFFPVQGFEDRQGAYEWER